MPRDPRFNKLLDDCYGSIQDRLNHTDLPPNTPSLPAIMRRVNRILDAMLTTYESKDQDYASNGKPMGNLRSSEMFGIPAYKGVLMRMGDKRQRIISFIERGKYAVEDEKVTDTLIDLSNYGLLGALLHEETIPHRIVVSAIVPKNEITDEAQQLFREISVGAIICKVWDEMEKDGLEVADWRETFWPMVNDDFLRLADYARRDSLSV